MSGVKYREKREHFSVHLPKELVAKINVAAEKNSRSRNNELEVTLNKIYG